MTSAQHVHLVGIGGIHMSGIASMLLDSGLTVSGSDLESSPLIETLRARGAQIWTGHDAAHVEDANLVVRTLAVSDDNPEIIAARQSGISILTRAEMVARLASGRTTIAIGGSHGKTTTSAKLAHRVQTEGGTAVLAACDTFRAAALEQIKEWGDRLEVPVVAGNYGADPASVGHDAITAAQARGADYLFIDTAGRLHTKSNLMQELEKLHRVIGNQLAGAPHEVLLVLDATTGMNALNQAREFHKAVPITGLVITKLDGTSKGGMVVAIHNELQLPVKFIGLGEQADDLQPFDARQFAEALFAE